MISRVTITGADDSINPSALVELSRVYPFVEWGILMSSKHQGKNKFPSMDWIDTLMEMMHEHSVVSAVKLSAHLCGEYVRRVLTGDGNQVIAAIGPERWSNFDRVQLNTHAELHQYASMKLWQFMNQQFPKEFIFQIDGVNQKMYKNMFGHFRASGLFDSSHGAGVLPKSWPSPIDKAKCGYAGGLSPENIEVQLYQIDVVSEHHPDVWIDMETGVRSNQDQQFDLSKVEEVLFRVQKFYEFRVSSK